MQNQPCVFCGGTGKNPVGEAEDLKPGSMVPLGRYGDCPKCEGTGEANPTEQSS
jgi:hypothetical protein